MNQLFYAVPIQVGMIALGWPKVNCQYETPDVLQRVQQAVLSQLPESDQQEMENLRNQADTPSMSPNNQLAFQVNSLTLI